MALGAQKKAWGAQNKALLPQVIREWASAASHLQRLVGVTLRELNGAGVDVSLRHVTRRSFASPAKKAASTPSEPSESLPHRGQRGPSP